MDDLKALQAVPAPLVALTGTKIRQLLDAPPDFIELLPLAAYACDASGRVLWFNRRAVALWGREPRLGDDTELFCGSYKLHFDGRQIGREETPMARALRSGEPVQGVQGIVERPDGSRVSAMVHIVPVKDDDGTVVGAINCFHDTTELHRSNEELRQAREELDDFFDNGAVALHLVGGDGTILRANKAELDFLGYAANEYVGRNIREFHADEMTIAEILTRLGKGEQLDRFPARLRAKDGSIKHVQITSNANFRNGRFINTRCFTVDVTAEAAAKQQAADSERRFQQLLEALPAAVYTTDVEGRITYYNKAAAELAGRTPEIGKDMWCVTWRLRDMEGNFLPHDECPMAVALKENRPVRNVEALAERPDGSLVPFLPYPTPLHDAEGNLVGAVNMLVDISERKQAETRQTILLKELNHRVKNNMQMLQSMLSAAQREAPDNSAREILADATRRVAAMAAAQKVLYDQGGPTGFKANDFLESVCGVSGNAFGKEVDIRIEASDEVLPNDIAMPLALILNELLTNAVKHGINGVGRGAVRVTFVHGADGYELKVEDDGPGFELEGARRKRSSGLGLVTGLAKQIGGQFSVQRGAGARCLVHFGHPLAAVH
jgi:PAS domain S-box-containing protein